MHLLHTQMYKHLLIQLIFAYPPHAPSLPDYRSHYFVQLMYRYPIFMDAFTAAIIRKGDKFLARWGDIMTGRAPKANLLRPEYIVVIGFELCVLLVKKLFGGYGSKDKKVM